MKELATESATANVTDTDRQKINAEFSSLKSEINRIVGSTVYQGSKLLDGNFGVQDAGTGTANGQLAISNIAVNGAKVNQTYTIAKVDATHISLSDGSLTQTLVSAATGKQNFNFDKLGVSFTFNGDPTAAIGSAGAGGLDAATIITSNTTASSFRVGDGAVSDSDNLVAVSLGDLTTASTGLNLATTTVDTSANATTALASIATAVGKVNTVIGSIGAAANRLDYASQNVSSLYQNIAAAESTIRDADMAQEFTTYSKLQILQQAGTAMLAQANSSSQSVLTLLRG
jgi:flagellin